MRNVEFKETKMKREIMIGAAVLALAAFSGCMNTLGPSGEDGISPGKGIVRVDTGTGDARTAIPAAVFEHYEYRFSNNGGTAVPLIPAEGKFELDAGEHWRVTVKAFAKAGDDSLAAEGASEEFTVIAGQDMGSIEVTIHPAVSNGAGTLTFSLAYPVEVAVESLILEPVEGETITLIGSSGGTDPVIWSGVKSGIPAGYYVARGRLHKTGGDAGKSEVVHVYKNMTTALHWSFTDESFTRSYGIALSESGTYHFDAAVLGYPDPEVKTVTITNTGNKATGALTISLDGDERDDFTLSPGTIDSIAVGANRVFTVTPKAGLAAGLHTAFVTVKGNNEVEESFGVSFFVQRYGIELDQSEDYTFPADILGYGAQTAKSVTVSNTGNQATGNLTVALSGTNSGSFALSKTTIDSIAVSGSEDFTVAPNIGLATGTYTATVTVIGDGNISARNFGVSFTVNPVPAYGISLDQNSLHTFPAATVGYGAQTVKSVTVNNNGNQATGNLAVALSGTDSGSFVLSNTTIDSIAVSDNNSFTVVPNTGLAIGSYSATVTVSGGNGITAGFDVGFTVNPHYLSEASVTGLVRPVTGAAPGSAAGLGEATGYTVQSIAWKTGGVDVSGTFAAAASYTATIVLQAGTDYQFTGNITPSVNVGSPSAGTITGTGPGNTLTFTVDFPAVTGTLEITITAWVNDDGTLITNQMTTPLISRAAGDALTVEAAAGLTNIQWSLNETDIPEPRGTGQTISFAAVSYKPGNYSLGLRAKKDNVWYSLELKFTVTE
jgi:hypothetical protein